MNEERDRKRFTGAFSAFRDVVLSEFPDREEVMLKALSQSKDQDSILAGIESIMFSAPEARSEKMQFLYEQGGLRGLLKGLGLDDEERLGFMNKLAGAQVAQLKK